MTGIAWQATPEECALPTQSRVRRYQCGPRTVQILDRDSADDTRTLESWLGGCVGSAVGAEQRQSLIDQFVGFVLDEIEKRSPTSDKALCAHCRAWSPHALPSRRQFSNHLFEIHRFRRAVSEPRFFARSLEGLITGDIDDTEGENGNRPVVICRPATHDFVFRRLVSVLDRGNRVFAGQHPGMRTLCLALALAA